MSSGGLGDYYDRAGEPITQEEFLTRFADPQYRIIKQDEAIELPGGGKVAVSTVWLGMNYSMTRSRPLIFETMVFEKAGWTGDYIQRYCTEYAAEVGHDDIVRQLRAGIPVHDLSLAEYLVDG